MPQSPHALIGAGPPSTRVPFQFNIAILGPGMALSIRDFDPAQGSLELMNIIPITPVNPTDRHPRRQLSHAASPAR